MKNLENWKCTPGVDQHDWGVQSIVHMSALFGVAVLRLLTGAALPPRRHLHNMRDYVVTCGEVTMHRLTSTADLLAQGATTDAEAQTVTLQTGQKLTVPAGWEYQLEAGPHGADLLEIVWHNPLTFD
jgi:mannose-6-phosphate isomerase-like protein (cupin superfamily)